MHEIFAMPRRALEHPLDPQPRVRQIVVAREGPPRETAAEPGEEATRHGSLSNALNGQHASGRAHEPSGERETLAGAIPPSPIPDAGRYAMRGQVEVLGGHGVCHAASGCKFGDIRRALRF